MLQGNALIAGRFVLKRHYADGARRQGDISVNVTRERPLLQGVPS